MKTLILLLLPLTLVSCDPDNDKIRSRVDTTAGTQGPSSPTSYGPFASTIKHDGHSFVVFFKSAMGSANGGVSAMHHPSCECLVPDKK